MNPFQEAVADFHEKTGGRGTIYTRDGQRLRARLIMEEAVETVAALGFDVSAGVYDNTDHNHDTLFRKYWPKMNLLEYIDGLCDLTYVVAGGAVNADIDLQRHFDEVHRANMRKLDGPKRADGKQLKPEGWVGPDHQRILELYIPTSETRYVQPQHNCSCGGKSGESCCG